jgi:hypothetical protein
MGMNKNTVLGWATFIMILMGLLFNRPFKYRDVSGWGFAAVGGWFLAAWVLAHLRVGFSYILNV